MIESSNFQKLLYTFRPARLVRHVRIEYSEQLSPMQDSYDPLQVKGCNVEDNLPVKDCRKGAKHGKIHGIKCRFKATMNAHTYRNQHYSLLVRQDILAGLDLYASESFCLYVRNMYCGTKKLTALGVSLISSCKGVSHLLLAAAVIIFTLLRVRLLCHCRNCLDEQQR